MQNTKYTLGRGHFTMDSFPQELDHTNGIIPRPVISDLIVGEEIGLFWLDRTPFIHELAKIRPFQFFLKSGLFRSDFGPLMWMLFHVPNPNGKFQPFASVEYHLNPFAADQVALWRRLANQTHWHLTLLAAGNEVADVFEFENDYGLDNSLNILEEVCEEMTVTDFMLAKKEFWNTYSIDELYQMS
jgi:hypothetical protein